MSNQSLLKGSLECYMSLYQEWVSGYRKNSMFLKHGGNMTTETLFVVCQEMIIVKDKVLYT